MSPARSHLPTCSYLFQTCSGNTRVRPVPAVPTPMGEQREEQLSVHRYRQPVPGNKSRQRLPSAGGLRAVDERRGQGGSCTPTTVASSSDWPHWKQSSKC